MCVITTTVSSYPGSAAEYYACNPELLTGSEAEGATPTFTADTATVVYALNLGHARSRRTERSWLNRCRWRQVGAPL